MNPQPQVKELHFAGVYPSHQPPPPAPPAPFANLIAASCGGSASKPVQHPAPVGWLANRSGNGGIGRVAHTPLESARPAPQPVHPTGTPSPCLRCTVSAQVAQVAQGGAINRTGDFHRGQDQLRRHPSAQPAQAHPYSPHSVSSRTATPSITTSMSPRVGTRVSAKC